MEEGLLSLSLMGTSLFTLCTCVFLSITSLSLWLIWEKASSDSSYPSYVPGMLVNLHPNILREMLDWQLAFQSAASALNSQSQSSLAVKFENGGRPCKINHLPCSFHTAQCYYCKLVPSQALWLLKLHSMPFTVIIKISQIASVPEGSYDGMGGK